MISLTAQLKRVKDLSSKLAITPVKQRNDVLRSIAQTLLDNIDSILRANKRDLAKAPMDARRERLKLTRKKIQAVAQAVLKVAALPDPLHHAWEQKHRPNGLFIKRVSVPLGVIGVIYESRPEVTVELASLALKSGNGAVLKGGKEAYQTNRILMGLIQNALRRNKLSVDSVVLINPTADWHAALFKGRGVIDVLVPRGGRKLIDYTRIHARVPVIETGAGVCHTLVDKNYNPAAAVPIIVNAKTQAPSICNSLDTLVVHQATLKPLLLRLAKPLAQHEVTIYADSPAFTVLQNIYPKKLLKPVKATHYGKEFLSLAMAIKTVENFEQGLVFVKEHTSGHSEAILTKNAQHAQTFLNEVDAAAVYQNASTRFTDGGQFGMGAEIGISTQKLHARGPMGLEALTSYKWIVRGNGQVRI
jgi:glutamate-5-semialdehyde dehydrogenase